MRCRLMSDVFYISVRMMKVSYAILNIYGFTTELQTVGKLQNRNINKFDISVWKCHSWFLSLNHPSI